MKRKIFVVCIAILLITMLVMPASADVKEPKGMKQWDAKEIWKAIMDLQKQINDW